MNAEAIAAASIAQVHRVTVPAVEKGGAEQVVALKVQHRGVDVVMMQVVFIHQTDGLYTKYDGYSTEAMNWMDDAGHVADGHSHQDGRILRA